MSELSTRAQRLIDANRAAADPSQLDRLRVRAALNAKLASLAAAPQAAAGAALAGPLKAVLVGAVVAACGAGLVLALHHAPDEQATQTAVRLPSPPPAPDVPLVEPAFVAPAPAAPLSRPVPAAAAPVRVTRAAPVPRPPSEGSALAAAVAIAVPPEEPAAPPAAPPQPACSFSDELGAVQWVQRSLSAGRAADAVRQLDELTRTCPDGAFLEERRGARLVASCELGAVDSSSPEVTRFLDESPRSPLIPRVLEACRH